MNSDLNNGEKIVIGVGPEKSGSEFNFILMCLLNGINPGNDDKPDSLSGKTPSKNIFYKNLPMNQMFNDFYNGKINGIYLMTGTKNVFISNLVKRMKIRFVDLIKDNSGLLRNAFKSYFYTKTINLGDYYTDAENQQIISP